ncbi:MAG: hypothetical protein N2544_00055 [Burkholderiales bacterium]|nr:hypothetical protein [Burkholderiales bacterium]
MRLASLALTFVLALALAPVRAAPPDDPLPLSRILALVQGLMDTAATAPPGTEQRAVDQAVRDILAGRNAEANAIARDILPQLSPEDRERLAAIARSAAALSERSATGESGSTAAERRAIDARKDLAAMGLAYHDPRQFLDAVRRGDTIAVRLFIAGRGVPLDARDADGASALDLARRSGNTELVALIAGAAR